MRYLLLALLVLVGCRVDVREPERCPPPRPVIIEQRPIVVERRPEVIVERRPEVIVERRPEIVVPGPRLDIEIGGHGEHHHH